MNIRSNDIRNKLKRNKKTILFHKIQVNNKENIQVAMKPRTDSTNTHKHTSAEIEHQPHNRQREKRGGSEGGKRWLPCYNKNKK